MAQAATGRMSGRTVVVTGAASGIGRASAERLLAEGATVLGGDLHEPKEPPAGAEADTEAWSFQTVDVRDEQAVGELVRAGAELGGGRLDGLFHAAGVAGGSPVHLLEASEWRHVIDVNLTGTFHVAKQAVIQMLGQDRIDGERGSIVTVASIAGLEGTGGGSCYAASKAGVVLLTKNMAIDYGPTGIRVNAVCPGVVDTPMTQGVFGDESLAFLREAFVRNHPMRRAAAPREIAAAVLFLLSADASFVTGGAFPIDGGYTAGRDNGLTEFLGLE